MENLNYLPLFLKTNKLHNADIAKYLKVSSQYIGQCVKGVSKLSWDSIQKLRENSFGWDCSMLPEGRIVQTIGNTTIGNHSVNTQILGENESLKKENELLKQLLEEKERTIQILLNK